MSITEADPAVVRPGLIVPPRSIGSLVGRRKSHYLYLVPAVVFFGLFIAYPIVSVVQASLAVHDQGSKNRSLFGNFQTVLTDPVFWKAAENMAFWAVLTVVVQMVVGGGLAYLIENHAHRSKAILRTIFLVPLVTSSSVVAIIWVQIYSPQVGLLSGFLSKLGITMTNSPLGNTTTAIFAIIVINIWQYTGFSMLMYIVGLHRIPGEVTEAAQVDGATGFRLLTRVIVPLLAPVTKTLLMLGIIGTLQTFPLVYLTTVGGPDHASEVFGTQIFRTGFLESQLGYASALSVITMVIALVVTLFQIRVLGARLEVGS